MRRPATAYSINRYEIRPESSRGNDRSKPHTTLEQRKFSNQMTICYVTPRRQTLIKSTEIKTKKEVFEWIQNDQPNGMEILRKIAKQTRSNYKTLINKALSDLEIVEKRANIMDEKDLIEKSKNSENVENQIIEYEKKLQKAKEENQYLRNELNNSKALYITMNDDINKLQSVLKNVKSKLTNSIENGNNTELKLQSQSSNNDDNLQKNKIETKKKDTEFINNRAQPKNVQIDILMEEEKRLEQQLIKLETRLMELNLEERSLLYGQFLPPSSNLIDNS